MCVELVQFSDGVTLRPSECGHAIEHHNSDKSLGALPVELSGFQLFSHDLLVARHRGFRDASSMITAFLLPSLASDFANRPQVFIARQSLCLAVAMLSNARATSRWNGNFEFLPLFFLSLMQSLVARPFVIPTVAADLSNRLPNLLQKLRQDFAVTQVVAA